MCMIDDGERYTVYHEASRTARKLHACAECGRTIAVGETYRCTSGLYDGHWNTNHVCAHCRVAAEWLMGECGGYLDGGIHDDLEEHAEEYRSIGLWRLVAGMQRKWKRFNSDALMPLPKMPPLTPIPARAA